MNLSNEFGLYLRSSRNHTSLLTIKNYRADVSQFIRWFEKEFKTYFDPRNITPQLLELYKKSKADSLSQRSIERHFSSLRKFFHFLRIEGIIGEDPFLSLKGLKDEKEKPDPWQIKNFKNYLYVYNLSNISIKNYIIDIKQFLRWTKEVLDTTDAEGVKEENIFERIDENLAKEYKQRLLISASLSPLSINRKLSSIRKYLGWARQEGLIKKSESYLEPLVIPTVIKPMPVIHSSEPESKEETPAKKVIISLVDRLLDRWLVLPMVNGIEKISYRLWKIRKKNLFEPTIAQKNPVYLSNVPKEFYSPLSLSTKHFPLHKKIYYFLRHQRPEWYKRYQSYSITQYFHFAILIIFASALGFGLYQSFFKEPNEKSNIVASVQQSSYRTLSFNGRLTDPINNPINSQRLLRFGLYTDPIASGSSLLWQEVDEVSPKEDGRFSILLGDTQNQKNGIPESIFANNKALWLGVAVETNQELSPRQQIPTIQYSSDSEHIQGIVPITQTNGETKNVLLALDSSGNLSIGGNASPTFQAIGGNFKLTGQSLSLTTNIGSSGNVQIVPDGLGTIDLQKPLQNTSNNNNISSAIGSVEIDDTFSVLATSSAQSAFTINQNSLGPLISASSSGTAKFTVDNSGNSYIAGTLGVGTATSSAQLESNAPIEQLRLSYTPRSSYTSFTVNSSGDLIIDSSNNNIVSEDKHTIGKTSAGVGKLNVLGSEIGKALVILDETGDQNILTASASGTTKFSIDRSGSMIAAQGSRWQPISDSTNALSIARANGSSFVTFDTTNARVGLGTNSPSYQLELSSDSAAKPVSSAWTVASDSRLKENIHPFTDGLSVIKKLAPINYTLNGKANMPKGLNGIGIIAQDAKDTIPYTISTFKAKLNPDDQNDIDLYSFNSGPLTFVLINAVKELDSKTDQLKLASLSQENTLKTVSSQLKDIDLGTTENLSLVSSQTDSYDQNTRYTLIDQAGNMLTRIGAFSQITVANIVVGVGSAKELTTDKFSAIAGTVTSLRVKNLTIEDKVISPIAEINQVHTNIISPLGEGKLIVKLSSQENSKFEIHNASNSSVATIDSSGNASFSGTLSSKEASIAGQLNAKQIESEDATISGVLKAKKIIAEQIDPAVFGDRELSLEFGKFSQGLIVLGATSLSDTSVIGELKVGKNLVISNNSINVLGADLSLQPFRQGNVSFMGDLITIDTEGNLKVSGNAEFAKDLSVKGVLSTRILSPVPDEDLVIRLGSQSATLTRPQQLLINNSSGSAVLRMNQEGDIASSGSGIFKEILSKTLSIVRGAQADTSLTETIASSSAGVATIVTGETERTIITPFITDQSLIYITPTSDMQGATPYIARQTPKDPRQNTKGSFTIAIQKRAYKDITLNWWIIN